MDIMTLSPSNNGNRYLFTMQDYRTKWIEAIASPVSTTQKITEWLDEIWGRFGKPKVLITDCGSQFESKEFTDYCKTINIEHHRSTPYHHQSNGMVERTHRTIWNLLRVVVAEGHQDWDSHLTSVLGVYRNTIHSALGLSPYEAVFGRAPELEADREYPTRVKTRIINESKVAKYLKNMKTRYDERKKVTEKSLEVGSKVLIKHPTIKIDRCQKLLPINKGPFEVAEKLSPNTYLVKDNEDKTMKVHRDQMIPTNIQSSLAKIRRRGRPRGGVYGLVMNMTGAHASF